MKQNLQKLIERGESLDKLEEKTENAILNCLRLNQLAIFKSSKFKCLNTWLVLLGSN